MHGSLGPLTNREISATVWIAGFLLAFIVFSSKARKSVLSLVRQFFSRAIFSIVLAMLLYTSVVIMVMRAVGLWDNDLIKDAIFWASFVAMGMLMNASSMFSDKAYFRKAVSDCFKVTVFVEYVSNLYSFSLWVELIMFPVLMLIVLMHTVAEMSKEYTAVRRLLEVLLLVFGCISLYFTIVNIAVDPRALLDKLNWLTLALPPILTIALLPFIYFLSLYMQYESLFVRLRFFEKDPQKIKRAKRTILRRFHFNLRGLNRWAKNGGLWELTKGGDERGESH